MKSHDYYYLAKRNLQKDANLRSRKVGILTPGSRIHVSAACGKAMASVTCLLKDSGYQVTASDTVFSPPMSDVLAAHAITMLPLSVDNVHNIDILVVGNVLGPTSPEVVAAQEKGIPIMSGTEVLSALLTKNKRSLVVAGTHGKTTTSALLTHVLSRVTEPAYMIGGSFQDSGKSYGFGSDDTKFAVFEGDEYDSAFFDKAPKFLRYSATSAIITSIEHDHIDIYPTFVDYVQAFQFLVDDLPAGGNLVIHESVVSHLDLGSVRASIVVYGAGSGCDYSYGMDSIYERGTVVTINSAGEKHRGIHIPLFGEYNIANATAVFALCEREGVAANSLVQAFNNYPGVHERQELLGVSSGGVTVVRDFAHHPTAVRVTLDGLRHHYGGRRIVCVFEPRSVTSRRKEFELVYPGALASADVVVISSPPFRSNDSRDDFMDVTTVAKELQSLGRNTLSVQNPEEALNTLKEIVTSGDVVVFMSNGDFGHIPNRFFESLT